MKTLKFRKDQVPRILNGQKTNTWRIFDEKDLQPGDQLELMQWGSGEVFARATVTGITQKQLGAITEPDFLGHEKFKDAAEMLNYYRDFYGNRVTMETMIKIVEFKLVSDQPTASPISQATLPPVV